MWTPKQLWKDAVYNIQKVHEKYLKFKEQLYKVEKFLKKNNIKILTQTTYQSH